LTSFPLKKVFLTCAAALFVLVVSAGCDPAQPNGEKEAESKQVATFEGGAVSKKELNEQLKLLAQQSGGTEIPEDSPQFQAALTQVMPQLIATEIGKTYAEENDITASDSDVDKVVDEELELIKQSVTQQAPDKDPEEAFQDALKENDLTEKKLVEDVEKQVRENDIALLRKVQTKVVGDAKPTEAEIEKYYKENEAQFGTPEQRCAQHILFNPDQKKKAEEVKQKLEDGGDFAKLAEENSQDPGSAENGGDLGCMGKGETVPPFEKAMFGADKGEIVGPVETEFGFHLIEVLEKKEASVTPLKDVSADIETQLAQQQQAEEFQKWVDDEKKKRDVKYLKGYDPDAPVPEPTGPEMTAPQTMEQTQPEATE
jgi:parvulin-like peptidyl-prolyl isomerase